MLLEALPQLYTSATLEAAAVVLRCTASAPAVARLHSGAALLRRLLERIETPITSKQVTILALQGSGTMFSSHNHQPYACPQLPLYPLSSTGALIAELPLPHSFLTTYHARCHYILRILNRMLLCRMCSDSAAWQPSC